MDRTPLAYPTPPVQERSLSGVMLFLSLFLLVLAFFILLVAISTLEEVKSKAVMDSLSSTFTTVLPPSTDPTEFTAIDGRILAGQQFQDQITGIFATAMQVAKVEIVQPGEQMRVSVPADSMFLPGEATIRPVATPLLDRIVAALSGRPPGVHFDMEFVAAVRPSADGKLPTDPSLEIRRGGVLAREMEKRGVPPDAVAVGVRMGNPDTLRIWFYIRDADDNPLEFLTRKKPAVLPQPEGIR